MQFKTVLFLTVFVTVFAHTLSFKFSNPFDSLRGVVKNEPRKLSTGIENDVRRIQIRDPFSSMLLRGHPTVNMGSKVLKLQEPFNWTTCGSSKQIMEIKSLVLKPSPLSFPGQLTFSFDVIFHDTVEKDDNVTAAVKLEFLTGQTWLKLPCLGSLGSCTYTDLCSTLENLNCPTDITKQGIKCQCPFSKGEYKLAPYTVEVDAEIFINGKYRAVVNLTSSKKGAVGCYKFAFSIE